MYLQTILEQKSNNYNIVIAEVVKNYFQPVVKQWAGEYFNDFFIAGSSAKGVAIKGKSDVDLFVSVKSSCPTSLQYMYETLFNKLLDYGRKQGFDVRPQNVSMGIKGLKYNGNLIDIDIVPAKQQNVNSNFHSLYKLKQNTWTQTNVKGHIKYIKESGRQNFIKLIKIWRDCHRLDFPSMNIELSVLKALYGRSSNISLEDGFRVIMNYFNDNFLVDYLIDPFNSANIVSNDMSQHDKMCVVQRAREACNASIWRQIIW